MAAVYIINFVTMLLPDGINWLTYVLCTYAVLKVSIFTELYNKTRDSTCTEWCGSAEDLCFAH